MLIVQLQSLLQKYNLWAKKRLGQHFLVDEGTFESIVGAADLQPDDTVVEVGPGTGFLTERLIKKVRHVTAVEYDPDMVRILKERFEDTQNLNIIHSDILKFNPIVILSAAVDRMVHGAAKNPPIVSATSESVKGEILHVAQNDRGYKVVANIPYYITSPLLKHFLQSDGPPSLMVLLVQKEVAEKICGISGKSMVTIETQVFGQPEIVGLVPASSFYPKPKVDSAILKIKVYPDPLVPPDQRRDFFRLVGFGFTQKRKKLSNALAAGLHVEADQMRQILEKASIGQNLRAENLEIGDWLRLTKFIF